MNRLQLLACAAAACLACTAPALALTKDEYKAENVFWVPKDARWSVLQGNAKQPSIGKTVDDAMVALERTAERFPAHGGAHHFLIHLVEASDRYVGRAERHADLLGPLMPSAGHMVHMPSHIDLRLGRWDEAVVANAKAIAAAFGVSLSVL